MLQKLTGLGRGGAKEGPPIDERLTAYESFVACAFSDLVGRDPLPEEGADAIGRLRAGVQRRELAESLLRGHDSRRYQITCHHERYLRRGPRPDELEFWSGLLISGKRHEDILAAMVSTSDFVKNSGRRADDHVRAIFRALLQHQPETTLGAHWAALIDTNSAGALALACGIVRSDEFRTIEVAEWFRRYLRRGPEAPELAHWLGRLKAGDSAERVQAALVGSEEYFLRAGVDPG